MKTPIAKIAPYYSSLILAAGLLYGTVSAQGAAVITTGTQWTDPSGGIAPGTEYDFFGATPPSSTDGVTISDYTHLDNFSVALTGGFTKTESNSAFYNLLAGSTVIAPGDSTPIQTGIIYNNWGPAANLPTDMLTFQLTNSSVSSFNVWILDSTDTRASGNDNASLSLSVNGGAAVTQTTVQTAGHLEWTEFTVTGASTSDSFTISVTNDSRDGTYNPFRTIAGITFSTVPEPATWAMMVGGMGVLAFGQHLRRRSLW